MLSQHWDQATHGRRKATHHLRDDKQEICLLSFHTIKQQKPAYPCGSSVKLEQLGQADRLPRP